jgi:hypothetical protein
LEDKDAERAKRIKEIVQKLDEQAFSDSGDEGNHAATISRKDTVVTTRFTIVGKVSPDAFQIRSRFGELTVRLSDLRLAQREMGEAPELVKALTVEGTYMAGRSYKESEIQLNRGDVVTVKAEGSIIMTPWGSNYRSTPDGNSGQYGWHLSGKIAGGALVAKIGSAEEFQVGSKLKFTAKNAGKLQFGIGMNPSYRNNAFPGQYNLKIHVVKAAQ